jgi:ubiquitin-protein ligase
MSSSAIKRVLKKDMKSIKTHNLEDMGIFIEFNEENILEAKAMIIGPKDSVYENGILFFTIIFPHNYPYSPPHISYISRDSIRIHPNLYTGSARDNYLGKVCLSILGTWSGPQWTTIMDISSVLMSIQSLLDMNPLDHEPGFSGKKSPNHSNYKECVSYERYRTLIIKNIFNIPKPFLCFKDKIYTHYKQNRDTIIEQLNGYNSSKLNNSSIYIPIYRIKIVLDYAKIHKCIVDTEKKLNLI